MNVKINDDDQTHYNVSYHEIVIDLTQILQFSIESFRSISDCITNSIAHEVLHKVIHEHINLNACRQLDNICSRKVKHTYGYFTLKGWDGGIFNGK